MKQMKGITIPSSHKWIFNDHSDIHKQNRSAQSRFKLKTNTATYIKNELQNKYRQYNINVSLFDIISIDPKIIKRAVAQLYSGREQVQ
jgi:hypothetical protein